MNEVRGTDWKRGTHAYELKQEYDDYDGSSTVRDGVVVKMKGSEIKRDETGSTTWQEPAAPPFAPPWSPSWPES